MTHPTHLAYLEDMSLLELEATVLDTAEENGKNVVILDTTVFYPQGGGQPYDQGTISNPSKVFKVEEVRFVDGLVKHIGSYESGTFSVGEKVTCHVEPERRALHARLHSAGHVIDLAVEQLGVQWQPGKGYHFPQGPYIEYSGAIEDAGEIESFKKKLEDIANERVAYGEEVTIRFMPKEEMHTVCHSVPEYLPEGKPARVVMYGKSGIPCGGTHVKNLSDIGPITVRKIKKEKDAIRVSYSIE